MAENYFSEFSELEDKLSDILDEAGLVHRFNTDTYPIRLTVRPQRHAGAQMQLFSMEGASSADMSIVFIFKLDGLEIRTDNRLVMPDALMTKIKGMAKKLHYAYLQADFAQRNDCAATATSDDDDHGAEAFAAFCEGGEPG